MNRKNKMKNRMMQHKNATRYKSCCISKNRHSPRHKPRAFSCQNWIPPFLLIFQITSGIFQSIDWGQPSPTVFWYLTYVKQRDQTILRLVTRQVRPVSGGSAARKKPLRLSRKGLSVLNNTLLIMYYYTTITLLLQVGFCKLHSWKQIKISY